MYKGGADVHIVLEASAEVVEDSHRVTLVE
jgi:hypothetical protein